MRGLDSEIRPNTPSRLLRATNVVAFALLLAVNVAAQTSVLGNSDLEISARFPTPLTPASYALFVFFDNSGCILGPLARPDKEAADSMRALTRVMPYRWAFTIWGAIMGLQAVGVVFQALPHGYSADGMKQRYVNGIGYGWQLGWLAEIAWQLLFQLQSPAGMVLCVLCLAGATAALGRTLFNMYRLKEAHGSLSSVLLYVAFFLPTSIGTAWLSYSAAVAALMVPRALHHTTHLDGCAVVLLALLTLLGVAVVQKYRDSAFGLTLVWALVAIYGEQRLTLIRIVSLVCICTSTLVSIFSMLRRKSAGAQTELSDVRQPLSRINTV